MKRRRPVKAVYQREGLLKTLMDEYDIVLLPDKDNIVNVFREGFNYITSFTLVKDGDFYKYKYNGELYNAFSKMLAQAEKDNESKPFPSYVYCPITREPYKVQSIIEGRGVQQRNFILFMNDSLICKIYKMKKMTTNKTCKNPFCIPDLTPMYEKVRDFILLHQGEKGFILTDNSEKDTIWTIVYEWKNYTPYEFEVKAVRVKDYSVQIIYDLSGVAYDDKSISEMHDDSWRDIQYDDFIYYIPTIFNLAENIADYV